MLKLFIFLKFFLLTKQEFFSNFYSSNEFTTYDGIPTLDLNKFTIYKNSNYPVNKFCFIYLSAGHAYISSGSGCSKYCPKNGKFTHPNDSESCNLHGKPITGQYLRTYNNEDDLILISLEGCYSIEENGSNLTRTFVITNNVKFQYNELLNKTYFWTKFSAESTLKCNLLCNNLMFDRCYFEQSEDEKKLFYKTFKHMDDGFFISPLKQEANYFSYNIKILLIVFGVVCLIICVGVVLACRKEIKENK